MTEMLSYDNMEPRLSWHNTNSSQLEKNTMMDKQILGVTLIDLF